MKSETKHLKHGRLNLSKREDGVLRKSAQKREGERRAIDFETPVLDWKIKKNYRFGAWAKSFDCLCIIDEPWEKILPRLERSIKEGEFFTIEGLL